MRILLHFGDDFCRINKIDKTVLYYINDVVFNFYAIIDLNLGAIRLVLLRLLKAAMCICWR